MKSYSRFLGSALLVWQLALPFQVHAAPPVRTPEQVRESVTRHNAFIREAKEREVKEKAMSLTPFTFYRATAHLFYEDIVSGRLPIPKEWEALPEWRTWISGDFHFQNVGVEDTRGTQQFELNDFDESCEAPFYWDLIRLAASVYLVKDSLDWPEKKERLSFKLTEAEADEIVLKFLKRYWGIVESNAIPALTSGELIKPMDAAKPKTEDSFVRKPLGRTPEKKKEKTEEFWQEETGGAKTKFALADTAHYAALSAEDAAAIDAQWIDYLASLDRAFLQKVGIGYFKILDRAVRLGSGLGSLGVRKVYLLIEGPTNAADDNLILEAKECLTPAPVEAGVASARVPSGWQGERVSQAIRRMVALPDLHEGWFNVGGTSYHVAQISPLSDGFKLKDFESAANFQEFADWTASALANAHCRANSRLAPAVIGSPEMMAEIQKLAREYALRVIGDYKAFTSK